MSERFPDIDWYCDECDEALNDQIGFSDHYDQWICTECGESNEISADSILTEERIAWGMEFLRNFDPRNYPRTV